jgi:hypothetical protein
LPPEGTLTLQSTPVPVALSVLAKPLPVKPPLSLSTVPSTPQKPSVFSWIVTCVPPLDELLELLLDEELDDELDELELLELLELLDDELLELLLDDELEDELLLELDDELLDELDELDEPPLEEPPSPVQVGTLKLPSCVPWNPKLVL